MGESLSIVIPAYNEERRLPQTLREVCTFLQGRRDTFEVIVVSDGSSDGTPRIVEEFGVPELRLIHYETNRGKGYAVRCGVLQATGERVLFQDADGSTPIAEIERLERELAAGADIAIGSRATPSLETKVEALWYRRIMGRVFNGVANLLLVPDIRDTQCGFKLFRGPIARDLFTRIRANGFAFDVELLYLARKFGYCVREVAVNWHSVPGSKVNLYLDSPAMFLDLLRFRMWDLLGRYERRALNDMAPPSR